MTFGDKNLAFAKEFVGCSIRIGKMNLRVDTVGVGRWESDVTWLRWFNEMFGGSLFVENSIMSW